MAQAFALLLLAQLCGEGLVHALAVPVPGPVAGLMLLALGLAARERLPVARHRPLGATPLAHAANGLLGHLSLLFVPAAVGVVQQGDVLLANGPVLAIAILLSTALTLAVTAATFRWAMRFAKAPGEAKPAGEAA